MIFPVVVFLKDIKELTAEIWTKDWGQLTQWWNDHNNGSRVWDRCVFKGTPTNDTAPAGTVGEYVYSAFGATATGNSDVFSDATSISLTAGDWIIEVAGWYRPQSNVTGFGIIGFSSTSGNSSAGLTAGINEAAASWPADANFYSWVCISGRQALASTTTIYCKISAHYASGVAPFIYGAIQAWRVR